MPNDGEEVYVSDIEVEVLRPFVQRKILDDNTIISVLKELIDKMEGNYAKTIKRN